MKRVVLLALLVSACDPPGPLIGEAYPLPRELSAIDLSYLPYEHLDDGCEYRAPYLAMELASRGIAASAVTVRSCTNELELKGQKGARWRYHTSVVLGPREQPRIVEPLLSSEFLDVATWRASFGVDDANVYFDQVAYPDTHTEPGACGETVVQSPVALEVPEMEAFDVVNLGIYCAYMRAHLRVVGGDWEAREAMLLERTQALFVALDPLGLIGGQGDEAQRLREAWSRGSWCPPPIPSK